MDINFKNLTITLSDDMDADHIGSILTEAVKQCDLTKGFINIVKICLAENCTKEHIHSVLENVRECFKSCQADNCIFIPIVPNNRSGITDIKVDKVEVVYKHDA